MKIIDQIQDRQSELSRRLRPAESYYKRESRSQTRVSSESDKSEGIEVVPGQYGSKFISSKLTVLTSLQGGTTP